MTQATNHYEQAKLLQSANADLIITVCRAPGDWQKARYRLDSATWFRFDSVSGGVGKSTNQHVYCNVWCDGMIDGELAHSCMHGPPPHEIKVCVTKTDNSEEAIRIVTQLAELDRLHRFQR